MCLRLQRLAASMGFGTTAPLGPRKNLPYSGVTPEPVGCYAIPAQLGGSSGICRTTRPVTCYEEAHSPCVYSLLTLISRRPPRLVRGTHPHFRARPRPRRRNPGPGRTLSDLVNQAYALTPAEIALMWQTAPTRMPIPPPFSSSGMTECSQSQVRESALGKAIL
jgi:hypothetical protein